MQLSLKHIGSQSDRSDGLDNKQDFDRLKLDQKEKTFTSFSLLNEEKNRNVSTTNNGDLKARSSYYNLSKVQHFIPQSQSI